MTLFKTIRDRIRRWQYQEGRTLSRFIAKDIRREILIVSAAKVEEGIITGRIRTTNVLYAARGLAPMPEFEPARELRITEMWHWTGKSWGGLPDGTSLAARRIAESQAAEPGAATDRGLISDTES
jgi:hypothetical protein